MTSEPAGGIPKFIRRVMPDASDAELQEATETFKHYMAVVLRIYERLEREAAQGDSRPAAM